MNLSLLPRLLFCLFIFGAALPGLAQDGPDSGRDPLTKLQQKGWKIVQNGVLQRELRANEVETFVFGEAGFSWKLRDLQTQIQTLRREFQADPTPELRQAIMSHRELIANTQKMIDHARAAEASGETTAAKAGCIPSYSYLASASYKLDRQGTRADASADFNVSTGCSSSGEVYAYAFAKTTVNGASSTATITDGPRSGANVSASADANRNGGGPCESYAYASVTIYDPTPTLYSRSITNERCPAPPDDAPTVNEDSGANTLNVLANDIGGPFTISSVTQPTNGTVVITNGGADLTYTPNANYCNAPPGTTLDTFTYTVSPGGSTATVTVTVNCVNDPPMVNPATFTLLEDSPNSTSTGTVTFTELDTGQSHTFSIISGNTGGAFAINSTTGEITVVNSAALDFETTPSFSLTVQVTDDGSPALSGTAMITVSITNQNEAPVVNPATFTVVENNSNGTSVGTVAFSDPEAGQAHTFAIIAGNVGGAFAIDAFTGMITVLNGAALDFETSPSCSLMVQVTDNGSPALSGTAVITINLTNVNEAPVVNPATFTINENSPNGTVVGTVTFTDPDVGQSHTFAITGGGFAVNSATGEITVAGVNNFEATPSFTLVVQVTDSGIPAFSGMATVTISVNNVPEPPIASPDSYDTIGNTLLQVAASDTAESPHVFATGSLLGNDSDQDVPSTLTASLHSASPGAEVTVNSDGTFTYVPPPGAAELTDTFTYNLTDGTFTVTGTVTIQLRERVWYVKNDAPGGGNGTSSAPFNSITTSNLSDNGGDGDLTDDVDSAGDYIFVYFGDGTITNQSSGLVLENGQHLIGQHAGLSLNVNLNGNGAPTNLVTPAAGNRPLLDDNVADGFEGVAARDVVPAEIVGMNLAGNVNGIDWTTTAAFAGAGQLSIRDNVIRSATNEGVDINLAGSGATRLAFHDNNLTSTGTALDIQETGTGALTITTFDDNVVSGNTGGAGIIVSNAVFDSVAGGGLNPVSGGFTVIGASGNPITGNGLFFGNVTGALDFADLDVFAGGAGVTVTGAGAFTGAAGTRVTVSTGVSIIQAANGPGADVSNATIDLQLSTLTVSASPTTGVSLVNVGGTFSAGAGSSITSTTGTDFAISGGTANVVYGGTITDDVGQLVSIASTTGGTKSFAGAITDGDDGDGSGISLSGNTGATIRFSGGLVLSTGANAAFAATGGGTVEVCDENPCNGAATGGLINKITTTTGMALNVANTNIGASNLELRSISAGNVASGPTNGILLNNTGLSGGLKVNGTGSAGSGGTIRNTTGDGISLNSTRTPSFRFLNIFNTGGHGIGASNMTAGLTLTSCQILGAGNGDNEHGLKATNVGGTISVNGSTFSDAEENLIDIDNNNTNLILFVDAGAFSHGALGAFTASGVQLVGRGSTSYSVNISNSQFTNVNLFAVNVLGDGSSTGTHAIAVDNNDFIVTTPGRTNAINLLALNTSNATFNSTNNEIDGGSAMQVRADDGSLVKATISGNVIANTHDFGISAAVDKSARLRLLIDNNQIFNTSSDGMAITNFDLDGGVGSELDAVITGNVVNNHNNDSAGNAFLAGIRVRNRSGSTCVKLAGNDVQGTPFPGAFFDYSLRETGGTMILEEDPDTSATIVSADYILDGGSPDVVDTTPPNVGGSETLDLVGTIDLSNGAVVCDRP